jgi:hypothetical protein
VETFFQDLVLVKGKQRTPNSECLDSKFSYQVSRHTKQRRGKLSFSEFSEIAFEFCLSNRYCSSQQPLFSHLMFSNDVRHHHVLAVPTVKSAPTNALEKFRLVSLLILGAARAQSDVKPIAGLEHF